MDAAQALADLTEISSQIQAAVLTDAEGRVLASTLDEGRAARMAASARALFEAAEALRPDAGAQALHQLEAATSAGSVFVVRDAERMIAATTSPEPTVGLVFYDLKSCLRSVAAREGDGKPRPTPPRARARAAASEEQAGQSGEGDGGS